MYIVCHRFEFQSKKKDGPESEDICIVTRVSQHTFVFYFYSCPRVTIELDSLSTRRKYKRRRSRNKSKPIPRLLPCILDLLLKYTIHFACFIFRFPFKVGSSTLHTTTCILISLIVLFCNNFDPMR